METTIYLITRIADGGVWGQPEHTTDAGGNAGGAEVFLGQVDPDDVTVGDFYEIDADGKIIAIIEE